MADSAELLFEAHRVAFGLGPGRRGGPVDIALPPGGAAWLKGPSGAGKTSLLKALARLRPLIGGEMSLAGRPSADYPAPAWRRSVAFLPQKPVMLPGSIEANLSTAFGYHANDELRFDRSAAEDLLAELGLARLGLGAAADNLSGGEQARIALARTLLIRPRLLLADEPLAHLDADSRLAMIKVMADYVARHGAGLILVSHDPAAWPGRLEEVSLDSGA